MNAQAQNAQTNRALQNSLQKLSSGLRVNRAADDASGMAIADKLRTQASALGQAIRNANDGIALVQIADMAMSEQSNVLDIVKTKLIQAKNGTTSGEGILAIARDIQKLLSNLNDIGANTNYNGNTLLQSGNNDKGKHTSFVFQVGELGSNTVEVKSANMMAANTGSVGGSTGLADGELHRMTDSLGMAVSVNGTTVTFSAKSATSIVAGDASTIVAGHNLLIGAGSAMASAAAAGNGVAVNAIKAELDKYLSAKMASVDTAINDLNKMRSEFGAAQNQLESLVRNMSVTQVNIKAAESGIRDVDYAAESANFNKMNIISQAGTYAMSQANQVQQNVLKLLQ
jgi:flagellin